MSPTPLHRSARLGRWAMVAMLCLVGQLVAMFHLGLVRHTRCAAHGELIHADAAEAALEASSAVAQEPDGVAVIVDRGAPHGGDHEHCQLVSDRSDAPPVGSFQPVASAGARDVAIAPAIVLVAARPLFRLAPKASPPVAA